MNIYSILDGSYGYSAEGLVPAGWLILGGGFAVLQAPVFQGLAFDAPRSSRIFCPYRAARQGGLDHSAGTALVMRYPPGLETGRVGKNNHISRADPNRQYPAP